MSCNCSLTYAMPLCLTQIQIGTIELDQPVTVFIKDVATGRMKTIETEGPDESGLLVVDIPDDVADFFSDNLIYELSVQDPTYNVGNFVPITIGSGETAQTVDCVTIQFAKIEGVDLGVLKLIE